MFHRILSLILALGIVAPVWQGAKAARAAQDEKEAVDKEAKVDETGEVQARGPIHEAFAEIVSFNPEPGLVVSKEVPEPIEETPPEAKPEGDNVVWIPGYWAWDEEREDFLWLSGVWRALPPGRQWIPGYWTTADSGSQWISGYWADLKTETVQYVPEPPETLEEGASSPAPSPDHIWVPGSWIYAESQYAWRPGYWIVPEQSWTWVPACYYWAPQGYVFVDGYWDYGFADRGVLFAPVYFTPQVYAQPNFVYAPTYVVNLTVVTNSLFLRPNYGHYYFGDYYAAPTSSGYYPWFAYQRQYGYGYDPIFVSAQWNNRTNRNWRRDVVTRFNNFRDNEDSRPSRTFSAKAGAQADNQLVAPLQDYAKRTEKNWKWQQIDKGARDKFASQGKEFREFVAQRRTAGGKAGGPPKPGSSAAKQGETLKSPIAAKAEMASAVKVPKSPAAPKVDTSVKPEAQEGAKPGEPRKRPRTKTGPVTAEDGDDEPRQPGDSPRPKEPKPGKGDAPKGEPKPAKPAPMPEKPDDSPAKPTKKGDVPKGEPKPGKPAPMPDKPDDSPAKPTKKGDALPKGEPKPAKPAPMPEQPDDSPAKPPKKGDAPKDEPKPAKPMPEAPKPESPKPAAPPKVDPPKVKPAPMSEAPKPEAPRKVDPPKVKPEKPAPQPEAPKPEDPKGKPEKPKKG